jgi:hypothetical protein
MRCWTNCRTLAGEPGSGEISDKLNMNCRFRARWHDRFLADVLMRNKGFVSD